MIRVRVTSDEREKFTKMAKEKGFKSVSEYIRSLVADEEPKKKQNNMEYGFVSAYEIDSDSLCQSASAVSPGHTGLVSKNGENPLRINYINSIKSKKCRRYGTFLVIAIILLASIPRTQRALMQLRNDLKGLKEDYFPVIHHVFE